MIFTERQAIKQRIEEIREERRALQNEYYELLDRLRYMDERELEAVDVESVMGNMTEAVISLQRLIPNIPADIMIRSLSEMAEKNDWPVKPVPQAPKPQVAPAHVISAQQANDARRVVTTPQAKRPIPREKYQPLKEFEFDIVKMLRELGEPVKIGMLYELYNDTMPEDLKIKYKAFVNRTNYLTENNANIVKPERGLIGLINE